MKLSQNYRVKLSKLLVYPKLATILNVEGRVIVKALIECNGEVVEKRIEYSDSQLLDASALKAIEDYGKMEPAVQKGENISCWLSIPITFKLR